MNAFPSRRTLLTATGLLLAVLAAYGAYARLPPLLDDWALLGFLAEEPSWPRRIAVLFDPRDRMFYRPLAYVVRSVVHGFDGARFAAYHVPAWLLLAGCAGLAGRVASRLLASPRAGLAAALVLLAATPIHLDTQCWGAGLNDLLAFAFLLGALNLHLARRDLFAAVLWGLALLCKESAAFLPAVLLASVCLVPDGWSVRVRRLLPYVPVGLVYVALRLAARPLHALADDHPYVLSLRPPTLVDRIVLHLRWVAEGLCPPLAGPEIAARPVWMLTIAGCVTLAIGWKALSALQRRAVVLGGVWAIAAALPLFLFPNHLYRYYLLAAWPGVVLVAGLAGWGVLKRFAGGASAGLRRLALGVVLACLVSGIVYARARSAEGIDQQVVDGTNELIRRGDAARMMRDDFAALVPALPKGAVVVVDNLDIAGFGPAAGLRLWRNDPTLEVFTAVEVERRPDRLVTLLQRRGLDRLCVVKRAGPHLLDQTATWRARFAAPAPKSD